MLQPGPFLQGSAADVSIGSGNYDFTNDAQVLYGELAGISEGWDAFLADLALLAQDPVDQTFGIDDNALFVALAAQLGMASLPELDTTIEAFNAVDPLLTIAIAFAPAASWFNPTAAFVPPDPNATILAPTIPLADYNPTVTGVVGGGAGSTSPSVTLSNLTRVGSLNFVVGDTSLLSVVAGPGQQVSVSGTINGVPFPYYVFGTTDANGHFSTSAVEGPEQVGAWVENWYVDEQLVQTFSFIVSPGN